MLGIPNERPSPPHLPFLYLIHVREFFHLPFSLLPIKVPTVAIVVHVIVKLHLLHSKISYLGIQTELRIDVEWLQGMLSPAASNQHAINISL
jgi:hypothetical protein